jgi:hypothetical protein
VAHHYITKNLYNRRVIKIFSLLTSLVLSAAAADPGFADLFDGRTLNGWRYVGPKNDSYFVEKGLLVTSPNARGNLFTEAEYANFILRFDFRLTEGANNGIGIRAPLEGDAAYQGMEIQILDHDAAVYAGKLRPTQYHGSIYDVFPAKTGALKRTEWNHEEISANGPHVVVTLNGTVIVDADLSSVTDPEVLKKHPGLKRASGHIGLLGHDSRVEFRNLQIRKL